MRLLLKIIPLLFLSFSINAQEFKIKNYFENGNIKTTEQKIENNKTEQIHYFPDGSIRSKGIIKNDVYTLYQGFDEDGTILASIKMSKNQDIELYTINKFYTNGKPLQNLTYVKDNYLINTYLPTGIWTSFSDKGQVIEEVTYNPKLTQVDCFKSGKSYYSDGVKKVMLSFNSETNRFTFEHFYPSGKTYFKAIFDYNIFLGKYEEIVEKSKLLNLLRSPSLINNYFYKKNNAINSYNYNYPNGNVALSKKNKQTKIYRLNGTIFTSEDEKFSPKLTGFTKCTSITIQKDCQAFYAENSQERLDYIPNSGRYIITADNLTKFTRVYDFSEKQNGKITYYGLNEIPLKMMTYKSGKLNGLYTSRHNISGEITSQGLYLDGKKEGLFKEYSELGILEFIQNFTNALKNGLYQDNGTIGDYWTNSFNSDIKEGEAKLNTTFTNETLMKGVYKNDLKDGKWKIYNFDFERYYPNSVLDYGIEFEFFKNNTLISKIVYY